MTTTTESKTLTITLTGRAPIKIRVEEWPVIAQATDSAHEGEYDFQASRKSKMALRVRKHSDGRIIVYGSYSYDTQWQGERSQEIRGGMLLEPSGQEAQRAAEDAEDIPITIREVARDLAERTGHEHFGLDMVELGQRCIADLPPERI